MIKIFKEIEWFFDYYFAWLFYNARKFDRYHNYMMTKWGKRYKKKLES